MKEVYIEDNLKKEKLSELLNEVKEQSNCFSISRYYEGYMSEEEFTRMQDNYRRYIEEENQKRVQEYLENINGYKEEVDKCFHFNTQEEAMDYFEDLYNQAIETIDEYQYCEFQNKKEKSLDIPEEWLISQEYTRITPVTIGPVFEVITLKMEAFDTVTKSMKKLFSCPYKVFGGKFEDLCCYSDERAIFKVCSHEEFAVYIR